MAPAEELTVLIIDGEKLEDDSEDLSDESVYTYSPTRPRNFGGRKAWMAAGFMSILLLFALVHASLISTAREDSSLT